MEMLRTRGSPVRPRLRLVSAGHLKKPGALLRNDARGEKWVKNSVLVSAPVGAPPLKSNQPRTHVLLLFESLITSPTSRFPTNRPALSCAYNCQARASCR